MQTEGERISNIISHFCKSKAEFARVLGESPQVVSNWVSRGAGKNVLNKILTKYPEINANWLLTGEGEMLSSTMPLNNTLTMHEEVASYSKNTTPPKTGYITYLLPMSAMGGPLTGFAEQGVTLQNCEAVVSPIENVDFAITVYGESMAPEYPSGSRVLIKKIIPNIFIDWGKVFVLDTPNGVIVKEIRKSEKPGFITCYSINPDPKFSPFDVPMSEIHGMYRVLMCLSAK